MTNTCAVDEALKGVKLPDYVVDKRFKVDLDSTGEQAVWVWIVMSDDKQDLPFEQVATIRDCVREALKRAGVESWSYVRFRTESEQSEIDNKSASR